MPPPLENKKQKARKYLRSQGRPSAIRYKARERKKRRALDLWNFASDHRPLNYRWFYVRNSRVASDGAIVVDASRTGDAQARALVRPYRQPYELLVVDHYELGLR